MSGSNIPQSAASWVELARAASQSLVAIPTDELLVVRDREGRRFRAVGPPEGVAARIGAVLIMLYQDGNDLRLPLTIRSELLPSHRGEVSLPGGATDPEDTGPIATALRECQEEIGVSPDQLEVWGALSPIYIMPSNFQITPVVAFNPNLPVFEINPAEVGSIITVTLRELLDPKIVVTERWTLRGAEVEVPFFAIANQKVWGATALVLSEFVARMRRILRGTIPCQSKMPSQI